MGRKNKIKAERKLSRMNTGIDNTGTQPEKPYVSQGPNDLFEGALAKAALAALSEEDREKYRIMGEHLHNNIDFQSSTVLNPVDSMEEAVKYVESQLLSGLHPSMMAQNEKDLMTSFFGDEWYLDWGYVKEDLDDIVTLKLE